MQTKRLIVGGALLLLAAGPLQSRCLAYQACVKKSGNIRVLLTGGACKKSETAITLNSARYVVDSTGKSVGQVTTALDSAGALLQINGIAVNVEVSSTGFIDNSQDVGSLTEVFTSSDCSGTAYLPVNSPVDQSGNPIGSQLVDDYIGSSVYVANNVLYYAGSSETLLIQSRESFADPAKPPAQPCIAATGFTQVGALQTFDLSTLGLTPPFSIQ